jgi:hypothetical protein
MRVLEKKTEQDIVDWWEAQDGVVIKLNLHGRRGWPDRLFLDYGPRAVFIEFKQVGEDARPLQEYIHRLLMKRGFEVYVADTFERAKQYLLARPGLSEGSDPAVDFSRMWRDVLGSRAWKDLHSSFGIPDSQTEEDKPTDVGDLPTPPNGSHMA